MHWKLGVTSTVHLQEWNLFNLDPSLQSISFGTDAHPTVSVDEAVAVGGHEF